jgi:hypothetical protein
MNLGLILILRQITFNKLLKLYLSILSQEIQCLNTIVIKHQSPHKGIGSIELQCHNIDLFAHLIFFFAQVHLQLIDIIWNTFVFPGANLEGVVTLKIDAANTGLT